MSTPLLIALLILAGLVGASIISMALTLIEILSEMRRRNNLLEDQNAIFADMKEETAPIRSDDAELPY